MYLAFMLLSFPFFTGAGSCFFGSHFFFTLSSSQFWTGTNFSDLCPKLEKRTRLARKVGSLEESRPKEKESATDPFTGQAMERSHKRLSQNRSIVSVSTLQELESQENSSFFQSGFEFL